MTRPERIAFLLSHYNDVLHGLRDAGTAGEKLPLMCRCWNSAAYQEIERLLPLLRVEEPRLYRAVVGMFVYPRFVRRAVCPRCGTVKLPNLVGELHLHQHKRSAAFVARMVRVPLYPVEAGDVDDAIAWLDEHWLGGVFVPDELLPLVAVA